MNPEVKINERIWNHCATNGETINFTCYALWLHCGSRELRFHCIPRLFDLLKLCLIKPQNLQCEPTENLFEKSRFAFFKHAPARVWIFFSMIIETFGSLRIFLDSPLDASKVSFAHSWWFDASHFAETRIEDQSHWTTPGYTRKCNQIANLRHFTATFFSLPELFICFPNCILNKNKKFVEQAPSTRAKWVQTRNILLSSKKKTFTEAFHVWSPSAVQLECGEIFILLLFSYPTSEGDVWKIF